MHYSECQLLAINYQLIICPITLFAFNQLKQQHLTDHYFSHYQHCYSPVFGSFYMAYSACDKIIKSI